MGLLLSILIVILIVVILIVIINFFGKKSEDKKIENEIIEDEKIEIPPPKYNVIELPKEMKKSEDKPKKIEIKQFNDIDIFGRDYRNVERKTFDEKQFHPGEMLKRNNEDGLYSRGGDGQEEINEIIFKKRPTAFEMVNGVSSD